MADLTAFGITAPKIAALQALQNAFEVLPTDVQLSAIVTQANQARDAKREEIEQVISFIRVRAVNTFGERSGFYKEFGFGKLSQSSDKEFLSCARMIAATAAKYLAQLAALGQTQPEIDDLESKADELEELLQAKSAAEGNRTESARTRITKGNEMYVVAANYCDFGRSFYANSNPAKYLDYIIYAGTDTPQTPPPAVTGVAVDAATGLVQWQGAATATGYKVEIKSPAASGTWAEAHEGLVSALEFLLPMQLIAYMIRIIAHNIAGFGPASEAVMVSFGLAAPGGFAYNAGVFSWVMVAGVSRYEMQASYDGGSTWIDIFDDTFTVGEYNWSPPPGMFRIRSKDGSEVSAWVVITVA